MKYSAQSVLEASALVLNVDVEDMVSDVRYSHIVRARRLSVYAMRHIADASYPEIAKTMRRNTHSGMFHTYGAALDMFHPVTLRQHVADVISRLAVDAEQKEARATAGSTTTAAMTCTGR